MGLLVISANYYYMQVYYTSVTTAALGTAGPLKSEIYAFYIKNGYWPNTKDFKRISDYLGDDKTVSQIEIEKGSFHLHLRKDINLLGGKVLSFRKAESKQQLDAPLWWVCGYSKIPEGMTANVSNKTNINKKYLQRICQ
ncbi:MAG: pilin [Gammaproteobacteria bacterium]